VFEALLWDNDGVLVDSEGLYFQATREVMADLGVALTEADYRQFFLLEARGAWHLAGELDDHTLAAHKRRRDDRYAQLLDLHADDLPIAGAAQAVASLARHHRMAIVTSSQRAHFERIHARTRLLPHFELVLAQGDYTNSKPHPEPYLTAVARLGVAPEHCLVIEDSERGLRAAKAAGLQCWVMPSALTRPCAFAEADRVLSGFPELCARLLPAVASR
jgi:HAD superfamily hydrolase (TIGR01509 family)